MLHTSTWYARTRYLVYHRYQGLRRIRYSSRTAVVLIHSVGYGWSAGSWYVSNIVNQPLHTARTNYVMCYGSNANTILLIFQSPNPSDLSPIFDKKIHIYRYTGLHAITRVHEYSVRTRAQGIYKYLSSIS